MKTTSEYQLGFFTNDPTVRFPTEEFPAERISKRIQLQGHVDIEMLTAALLRESATRPGDFLSGLEVNVVNSENSIIISGYAPSNNYNIEDVLEVVRRYDAGATFV